VVPFALLLLFALASWGSAGEIPGATLVLEVSAPGAPGMVNQGTPPRFVLMGDGQIFVGGTNDVAVGRLERNEEKEIEKRVSRVRRLPGLGASVVFGTNQKRQRLLIGKGRSLEIVVTGEPLEAPPQFKPLAQLLTDLSSFNHPSLRPYHPKSYALSAREHPLTGGCRYWGFTVPLQDCLGAARVVLAESAGDWPTGTPAAGVCSGDKTYLVSLRPLLPGEKP